MRSIVRVIPALLLLGFGTGAVQGQQFNSDSYLTMPHGVQTTIASVGTEYSGLLAAWALFPGWEFTAGAFLNWERPEGASTASWSSSLSVKRVLYENAARSGGFGMVLGTGNHPGNLQGGQVTESFRSFFATALASIPLIDGTLFWDLNPGVLLNTRYGDEQRDEWGFSYSTRAALHGVVPASAIVGEVYGTAGGAKADPQYRVGLSWEPNSTFAGAVTWSQAFDGSTSGGFELGILVFSPPYACFGGCRR